MKESARPAWVRVVILALFTSSLIAITAVGLSLAQGPLDPSAFEPEPARALYAVRVAARDAERLSTQGIEMLPPDEQGGIVAHVTQQQLSLLEREGIESENLGRVAVLANDTNPGLLGKVFGFNDTHIPIPGNASEYDYERSDIVISAAPPNARVTSISYYLNIQTDLNPAVCPGEGACGQVQYRICRASHCLVLDHQSICCNAGAVPSDLREGPDGDAGIQSWGCVRQGDMSTFNGDLVNGVYTLRAQNRCQYYQEAYIGLWYIWVYYDDPTPTPTRTATRTRSPTDTPVVPTRTPTITPTSTLHAPEPFILYLPLIWH